MLKWTNKMKSWLRYLFCMFLGAFSIMLLSFIYYLGTIPELKIWHDVILENEYSVDSDTRTFSEYLKIEENVFDDLERNVVMQIPPEEQSPVNRYTKGSLSDPEKWPRNWNRTFELIPGQSTAGILLLHGMSDSPYSLNQLGTGLYDRGAHVLGLRLPGHGTLPSGLLEITWEDMAGAVSLALDYLQNIMGDKPVYIIGYSTGGALALHYALSNLKDQRGGIQVSGIVLISPSLGVTPMASYAKWQVRLSHIPGLKKMAWNSMNPEYDPFKYGGFAVNAGDQVFRLTRKVLNQLLSAEKEGNLHLLPPVLAFQSVADATVSTPALVNDFFVYLPDKGHELVLFDINRVFHQVSLLRKDPMKSMRGVLSREDLPFVFSLITNDGKVVQDTVLKQKYPGQTILEDVPLDLSWRKGQYSLSHVSLPFSEYDPLYGPHKPHTGDLIHLGSQSLRGERGLLQIPAYEMSRLRWNPFYSYLETRVFKFLEL